jgi:ABC-type lipoprotein release transport system permease subunit
MNERLAVSDFSAAFSYPMVRDLEARQHAFIGLAAHYDLFVNLGAVPARRASSVAPIEALRYE